MRDVSCRDSAPALQHQRTKVVIPRRKAQRSVRFDNDVAVRSWRDRPGGEFVDRDVLATGRPRRREHDGRDAKKGANRSVRSTEVGEAIRVNLPNVGSSLKPNRVAHDAAGAVHAGVPPERYPGAGNEGVTDAHSRHPDVPGVDLGGLTQQHTLGPVDRESLACVSPLCAGNQGAEDTEISSDTTMLLHRYLLGWEVPLIGVRRTRADSSRPSPTRPGGMWFHFA